MSHDDVNTVELRIADYEPFKRMVKRIGAAYGKLVELETHIALNAEGRKLVREITSDMEIGFAAMKLGPKWEVVRR